MKNEDLHVYKKSDFYEDFISSQKEYYERANADAYFAERLAEKDREIALLKERICNGDVSRLTWIDDCFDKDKEIAELKEKYKELAKLHDKAIQACCDADKVIAHHKYKRCLAMAYVEWLRQMILCDHPESILYRRAARREHKWKEMAQKFKEAK